MDLKTDVKYECKEKAINDLIPPEWDYVLRKKQSSNKVHRLYVWNGVPTYWRNNKYHRKAVERIRFKFSRGILDCIDAINTPEGYHFWKKIELEIETYKEQIRWIKLKSFLGLSLIDPEVKQEIEKLQKSLTSKMDFLSRVKDQYNLSLSDAKIVADKFFKKEV